MSEGPLLLYASRALRSQARAPGIIPILMLHVLQELRQEQRTWRYRHPIASPSTTALAPAHSSLEMIERVRLWACLRNLTSPHVDNLLVALFQQ